MGSATAGDIFHCPLPRQFHNLRSTRHRQRTDNQCNIIIRNLHRVGSSTGNSQMCGPLHLSSLSRYQNQHNCHELRLPQEKLSKLKELLSEWQSKKVCSREKLESLLPGPPQSCLQCSQTRQIVHWQTYLPSHRRQNANIATSLGLTVRPGKTSDGGTCSLNLGTAYPRA